MEEFKGEMRQVESTSVEAIGYEKEGGRLCIRYGVGLMGLSVTWLYANVPEEVHSRLLSAESIGRAVRLLIVPHYRGVKMGANREAVKRRSPDGPVYQALRNTESLMKDSSTSLLYCLWVACGKPDTKDPELTGTQVFTAARATISDASGCNTIGAQYLKPAMALAAEKGL